MKKLVIFDLDGTLLDTIADLADAANYALKQLGHPTHPVDTIRTYVGNGINKLLERALPENERNEENVMRMRSHFVPYYDMHNADLSAPYPGIVFLSTYFPMAASIIEHSQDARSHPSLIKTTALGIPCMIDVSGTYIPPTLKAGTVGVVQPLCKNNV